MGQKVGSEVDFFVAYLEFSSDAVPVRINCTYGKVQHFSNIFCAPALSHKIGYLDLRRREVIKLG